MRAHYVLTCVLVALAISSCEDNPAVIDLDDKFKPDNIIDANMYITGQDTVTAENIESSVVEFSTFNYLMLGQHKDPKHGSIKADFTSELSIGAPSTRALNEVYEIVSADKKDTIKVKEIEYKSCEFHIHYSDKSWLGDTSTINDLIIYELTSTLDRDTRYNSDFDPSNMFDKDNPIGELEYVVRNTAVDTLWENPNYIHQLTVSIDNQVGLKIFNTNLDTINSQDLFRELINGVYITTEQLDNSDGSLLRLNYNKSLTQELVVFYDAILPIKDHTGQADSIINHVKKFPINTEVPKAITYDRNFDDSEIIFNDTSIDNIYLQGMKGAMAKIVISDKFIKYWQNILPEPGKETDSQITSIGSAELSFYIDTLKTDITEGFDEIPKDLSIYMKNESGDFIIPRFDRSTALEELAIQAFSTGKLSRTSTGAYKYTFSFATGFFEEFIWPNYDSNGEIINGVKKYTELYVQVLNPNFNLQRVILKGMSLDEENSNITVRYVEVN